MEPNRKPTRLKAYDYSRPGAYFITICTQNRRCILSEIVGEGFPLPKKAGEIAVKYIENISLRFPTVSVDKYVVMPNHIHMLLSIEGYDGRGNPSPTQTADIKQVIGWFKYFVTKDINLITNRLGNRVFQRSYFDHVIRGEQDYREIWEYIENNPRKWQQDQFFEVK